VLGARAAALLALISFMQSGEAGDPDTIVSTGEMGAYVAEETDPAHWSWRHGFWTGNSTDLAARFNSSRNLLQLSMFMLTLIQASSVCLHNRVSLQNPRGHHSSLAFILHEPFNNMSAVHGSLLC
jgi:hypothetical protein